MSQFLRFGIVGVIGFLVDTAVLYGLLWCSAGYFSGRIVSFLFAATATWLINRRITFQPGALRSLLREWSSYILAMSLGGFVNLAGYQVVMSSFPYRSYLPVCAVGVGSLAGMLVNFSAAKLWVFRHPERKEKLQN